ncbi:MAG: hypothetical protein H7301_14975 [Cryobacterium sp.]|nr:hypothetical protein [Oligoflexia bacterium]
MTPFHAHIYFSENHLPSARLWEKKAKAASLFTFVQLQKTAIGPHRSGMIETHFNEENHESVLKWLNLNREHFSVFIHQDTGDDHRDHTQGIQWLGPEMELDFNFFELIKKRPELRIHG